MQKGFTPIFILIGALIISMVAGGSYYLRKSSKPAPAVTSQAPQPIPFPPLTNWEIYKNQQLNYQIKYPPDAKLIKPTWNTVDDKPSDVIIKFDFDLECLDKLGKEDPDTYVECLGESVDIFVFSNVFKTAQQIAEEDKSGLRDGRCTISTTNLGTSNLVADELTGCLVSGSSFYYLTGTDRHIFKIGVSNNKDPKTKQILSSFQIIKPDILYKECKVGKDDELKDQCPPGYKCEFTGEYPDEINNFGNCVRQ